MTFGNSLEALLTAAGIAAAVLVLFWVVIALTRKRFRDAATTRSDADDFFLNVSHRTKLLLLILPAIFLGARALILPRDIARLLKAGAALSFIAQCALWFTGVIDFWIRRYRRMRIESDPGAVMTVNIFRIAAVVVVWIVATLVAIEHLGFNVATLVAGLGIGGVAVALALQNILGDLFASLSIVIDKPFVIGDAIAVDDHSGTVEHIGLKTTRLRATGGEELIFSNGDLLKSRIRNFKRMTERRAMLRLSLAPDTPAVKLERVPTVLRASVEKQKEVNFERAHLTGISANGFEAELAFIIESADFTAFADARQAVIVDIVRALDAEDIKFAWHTRTMC